MWILDYIPSSGDQKVLRNLSLGQYRLENVLNGIHFRLGARIERYPCILCS